MKVGCFPGIGNAESSAGWSGQQLAKMRLIGEDKLPTEDRQKLHSFYWVEMSCAMKKKEEVKFEIPNWSLRMTL
jgi:hypothetical protein